MIRDTLLGFVDHDAVKRHEVVLRQPMDMDIVYRLAAEMGEVSPTGDIFVDKLPFILLEGYLTVPAPVLRPKAIDFIVRLAQETGCDIADIELGFISTPSEFRAHCELMSQLKAPSPFTSAP